MKQLGEKYPESDSRQQKREIASGFLQWTIKPVVADLRRAGRGRVGEEGEGSLPFTRSPETSEASRLGDGYPATGKPTLTVARHLPNRVNYTVLLRY